MTCQVTDCNQDTSKGGKGLCGMHYARLTRTGKTGVAQYVRDPRRSTADRVYPNLSQEGDCWVWTRSLRNGYGAVGVGRRVEYVHRWVYRDLVGEIPEELVIDHLCVNRACANPHHLDLVPRRVNNARGGLRSGERRIV